MTGTQLRVLDCVCYDWPVVFVPTGVLPIADHLCIAVSRRAVVAMHCTHSRCISASRLRLAASTGATRLEIVPTSLDLS